MLFHTAGVIFNESVCCLRRRLETQRIAGRKMCRIWVVCHLRSTVSCGTTWWNESKGNSHTTCSISFCGAGNAVPHQMSFLRHHVLTRLWEWNVRNTESTTWLVTFPQTSWANFHLQSRLVPSCYIVRYHNFCCNAFMKRNVFWGRRTAALYAQ